MKPPAPCLYTCIKSSECVRAAARHCTRQAKAAARTRTAGDLSWKTSPQEGGYLPKLHSPGTSQYQVNRSGKEGKPRKTARNFRKEKKGRKGTENTNKEENCKLGATTDFSNSFLTNSSGRFSVERSLVLCNCIKDSRSHETQEGSQQKQRKQQLEGKHQLLSHNKGVCWANPRTLTATSRSRTEGDTLDPHK